MAQVAYMQPDPAYRRELGENQSSLKYILKSPAHYRAAKKKIFSPTIFMEMGSALHCKVLEGDEEFDRRYVKKPDDISLTTTAGREWKASVKKQTILSSSDKEKSWDSVLGMTESLRQLDWFDGKAEDYRKFNELSIYWTAQGIPCKARLDRLVDNGDHLLVLDLKTTDSVDPDVFKKKVAGGMNYIFQAAYYAEAASLAFDKPAKFIFIAIERSEPWSVGIFEVSDEMMEEGTRQVQEARRLLRNCISNDSWPKREIFFHTMELPKWYRSPLEQTFVEEKFEPLF
ncbi:MAG: PD-(D/E)XK nuclease-like domain-containing protein [bacterium]